LTLREPELMIAAEYLRNVPERVVSIGRPMKVQGSLASMHHGALSS